MDGKGENLGAGYVSLMNFQLMTAKLKEAMGVKLHGGFPVSEYLINQKKRKCYVKSVCNIKGCNNSDCFTCQ